MQPSLITQPRVGSEGDGRQMAERKDGTESGEKEVGGVNHKKRVAGKKGRELVKSETCGGAKPLIPTEAGSCRPCSSSRLAGAVSIPIAPAQIVFLVKYGRGQGKGRRFVDFV